MRLYFTLVFMALCLGGCTEGEKISQSCSAFVYDLADSTHIRRLCVAVLRLCVSVRVTSGPDMISFFPLSPCAGGNERHKGGSDWHPLPLIASIREIEFLAHRTWLRRYVFMPPCLNGGEEKENSGKITSLLFLLGRSVACRNTISPALDTKL